MASLAGNLCLDHGHGSDILFLRLECKQMLTAEQREKMTVSWASSGGRGGGQGCRMGRW
jgi:hypothetical protein